jgi:tRNA splicing ligase
MMGIVGVVEQEPKVTTDILFVPLLACSLNHTPGDQEDAHQTFADELEKRLKRHLASHLTPMNSFVQTILLAKAR